ncbi:MAG: tetratricopeptide repeat protein, partial [Saprospiraceae bacterium]
ESLKAGSFNVGRVLNPSDGWGSGKKKPCVAMCRTRGEPVTGYPVTPSGTPAPDAVLLLENEFSMQPRPTPAVEFAAVLAADPARQPALVLLSSCQSGVGSAEKGFRGVAHRLMQAGVPAVVGMGWSVTDFWATQFAGAFFKNLAARRPLGESFNRALDAGRKLSVPGIAPEFFQSQSLIPQLFLTKNVGHLVVWQGKSEKRLARAADTLLRGDDQLARKLKKVNQVFGREGKDLLFIGRRRERKTVLAALGQGRSVLLRGQGGMGKTALALHLAWRKLAANPDGCLPLAFDQTNLSLENVCNALLDFLETDARQRNIRTQIAAIEKQWDKFYHLLGETEKQGLTPFFIFDNLETFQPDDDPGGPLRPDIAELLGYMLTRLGYPVLCTGRYPLSEFDSETLAVVDLNEAPAADFRQKCLHLPALRLLTVAGRTFDDIAATLHRSLGGNYRSLEDFDELCRENPDDIPATLQELDDLIGQYAGQTLRKRAEDLVFGKLTALLSPAERRALLLLAEFRRPVLPFAVEGQDASLEPAEPLLVRAADLTLAERRTMEVTGRDYFFVPPLVRNLLKTSDLLAEGFDDERAGAFFEKVQSMQNENLDDFEEAFFHYERVKNVERLNDIGERLSRFYYQISQFQRSFGLAMRAEAVAGEQTDGRLLNTLGLLFQFFGNLDAALRFFQRSLADDHRRGDRKGEGTTLNNISQIHKARGDYDTSLSFLQQSLKIRQEIGYRAGERVTLNNISQIHQARGDYDTALSFLQQSLKIQQEIGDRAGEGTTLNNLATTAHAKGDYDTSLSFLQQSLKIQQEIGDINDVAVALTNMGATLYKQNRLEESVPLLQQAYQVFEKIGSPNVKIPESYLNAIIQKIGQARYEQLVRG